MSEAVYTAPKRRSGWVGWIGFASVIMCVAGTLNIIYGVIAAINDEWVVFGNEGNLYLDLSQWGWIHIIMGALVLLAGLALFSGNVLARTVGVILAALSILVNFAWMPVYPVWALIVITMDVLVIWALTAHGRDAEA